MQNERLHDLVAVRHVSDHIGHVVLGRAHKRGAEHEGQVPGFHLRDATKSEMIQESKQ